MLASLIDYNFSSILRMFKVSHNIKARDDLKIIIEELRY